MAIFFTVTDWMDGGRNFQASVEMDDDGRYGIVTELDNGFREERFSSYEEAVEGIAQLWPEPGCSIRLHRS